MNERDIDKHSVNCYFCGGLVDERECQPAGPFNGDDGGEICDLCRKVVVAALAPKPMDAIVIAEYRGDTIVDMRVYAHTAHNVAEATQYFVKLLESHGVKDEEIADFAEDGFWEQGNYQAFMWNASAQ